MFVNGVEQADKIDNFTGVAMGADRDVTIGSNSEKNRYWWDGVIDEVAVWNRALSAEEIEQLYLEGIIEDVEDVIAQKDQILEAIDEALEKEWAAYDALEQLLESKDKDYDGLKKGDIVQAKQKIHSAIQHEQQSTDALEKSIKKLEDALTALGWEPIPEPEPDPNLVSYWQFDEGQGDIAYDSAGNKDGTIYGALWIAGKIGDYALDFDGDDDSVELPLNNPVWLPTGDFSLSMWVYPTLGAGNTEVFFDADVGWSGHSNRRCGWSVSRRSDNGKPKFVIVIENNQYILTADTPLYAETWYHIVAVRNGTSMKFYLDAVEDGSLPCPLGEIDYDGSYSNDEVRIGAYRASGELGFETDGTIDNIRLYDRVLSAQEIQELYEEGLN